jgi:two-component system, NarL family, sensor histidine kinase UhpB
MRAQHNRRTLSDRRWPDERRQPPAVDSPTAEQRLRARAFCAVCGHTISVEEARRVHDLLERQANSIAQALHDESGQFLTAAHVTLAEASIGVSDADRERLEDVRKYLDAIEDQLRRIAHEIRPRLLEDVGLVAALEFLADSVEKRRGLSITVDAVVRQSLSPQVETIVYRVVQEALNNIARHASATNAWIHVRSTSVLQCTIQDDGVGFDVEEVAAKNGATGLGFFGIRQRLGLIGGKIDIRSAPGRGTEVVVVVPLNP